MSDQRTTSPTHGCPVVADKLTPLIVDALSRAAADPGGVPLYGTKADPGLFPSSAAARPAAQKCLDEGLIRVVRTETKGKQSRDLCAATEAGMKFLLDRVSPKQVLEDFVRVLEAREAQAVELTAAANGMMATLAGMRASLAAVLPQVQASRVGIPDDAPATAEERPGSSPHRLRLLPFSPPPSREESREGSKSMNGVATLEAPTRVRASDDLAAAVVARLSDWSASAGVGQDCPLPELYRSLSTRERPPSIGTFHDCLRQLHDDHRVYLHPWTGPLYALPEPACALLVGHEIAYYASSRNEK